MKSLLERIKASAIVALSAGVFGMIGLTGCTTAEDGGGRIGPDYDDPLSQQIRMQEAQSRVTRSLVR